MAFVVLGLYCWAISLLYWVRTGRSLQGVGRLLDTAIGCISVRWPKIVVVSGAIVSRQPVVAGHAGRERIQNDDQ
jgi:hypothetical protein